MKKVQTLDSAKERILKTASDLFYRQGYRSTGTNEIIKKAGVAKASFFYHFPTKEALALAYLKTLHAREAGNLFAFVNKGKKIPRFPSMKVFKISKRQGLFGWEMIEKTGFSHPCLLNNFVCSGRSITLTVKKIRCRL